MEKKERRQIRLDLEFWNSLADALGWRLLGFTFRTHATFIDSRDTSVTLTGGQAFDILEAIDQEEDYQ